MGITESQVTTETKLKRIAFLSSRDSHKKFTSLMHHFNEESLEECFNQLDGRKAVGIDGINKEQYAKELNKNIADLLSRMKQMSYRPNPVRQTLIPKEGKPGATRPLGISNFEDKIVQKMMHRILESIYEPNFLECSYGFRPGRGCHDAVICCQFESDARRIVNALGKRLAKYKLVLNKEKTKLINFQKKSVKKAALDFLGFTHYLGRSKNGVIIPKLKTIGKRMKTKLKRVSEWARKVRNRLKLNEIWRCFCEKLRGHISYYGVSHNFKHIESYIRQAVRILFKWLSRRSQRKSFTWNKFEQYVKINPLPKIKVYHSLF